MTTVVSVAQGGTGSNSAALARTALGVPPSAAYDQANTARDQANTARTQANSAYSDANTRLSASGGTLAGDLIITGNLTVSGNSTTLNAEILTIEDADVVLLSNVASTPALNAGIIVNRGTSTNTFLRWDEVTDKWGWSDDGSTTYKFTSALDAYAQANSAYGAANNRVLKAGDTMTGQLNISAGGLVVTGNSNFDSGTLFVDSVNDRIGIGTASPSSKLHILDSTGPVFRMVRTSNRFDVEVDNNAMGFVSRDSATANAYFSGFAGVGIGTASPATKLHVNGGSSGATANPTLAQVVVENNADAGIQILNPNGNIGRVYFGNPGDTDSALIRWEYTNNNFDFATDKSGAYIRFLTDLFQERMRITSSGNVGIGTANPFSKLQVGANTFSGGNGTFSNDRVGLGVHGSLTSIMYASTYNDGTYPDYGLVFVHGSNTSNYNVWSLSPDGPAKGNSLNFIYGSNATNIHTETPKVVFRGDGNVGIGTTTPRGNLDVGTATASAITRSIHLGYSAADFYGFRLTNFNTAASFGAGNFLIQRGTTAAWVDDFAIDNNGNVGIGNSGPGFKFDLSDAGAVISGTATTGSNMKGIRIYNTTTGTTNNAIGLWMATGPHQAGIASFRASADTGWDTCLAFYTHVNAVSNLNDATEKMRIHGQGYVTMPLQPRFYAYGNVGGTHASGSFVRYGYTYVNVGSHYSSTNGRFTAPVTGDYYLFWGSIAAAAGDVYRFYLYKNGADTGVQLRVDTTSTGSEYGTNGSRAIILSLAQNDYVQIYYAADAGTSFYPAGDESSSAFTHFGGYLLG